jgi:hypothetical protein
VVAVVVDASVITLGPYDWQSRMAGDRDDIFSCPSGTRCAQQLLGAACGVARRGEYQSGSVSYEKLGDRRPRRSYQAVRPPSRTRHAPVM